MAFQLVVEPEAEDDLANAYDWYEEQRAGLGIDFLNCINDVFRCIRDTPEMHAVAHNNVRQTLVKRFPYVVCYTVDEDPVYVVAVFHGHRDPNAWKSRTS